MKKLIFALALLLSFTIGLDAQISSSTTSNFVIAPISITYPTTNTTVMQGSAIICTWTHEPGFTFNQLVKVMVLSQVQRIALYAQMVRFGTNPVPLDSIRYTTTAGTSTQGLDSRCDWEVPLDLAPGNYALAVRTFGGKLGVGNIFSVAPPPPAPNIVIYTPIGKGKNGEIITFTGRDIRPEAVQVFIGSNKLEIRSATIGQVVAIISGTQPGALTIGHGQPSNTVTLESNFRPVGQPTITDIQPRNFTKGTLVTITGKDLDSVIFNNPLRAVRYRNVFNLADTGRPTSLFSVPFNSKSGYTMFNSGEYEKFDIEYLKKRTELTNIIKSNGGGEDNYRDPSIANYYLTGPKVIKINDYQNYFNGSKITFTVENVYQTFDRLIMNYNRLDLNFFALDSPEVKLRWKFSLINGKDLMYTVIMPLISLTYNPPLPHPPPQPIPAPTFEVHSVITNSRELSASNNFVRVTANRPVANTDVAEFIEVRGKSLENAVAKLGPNMLFSRIKKVNNAVFKDDEGYEILEVGISFTAYSDFLSISKNGKTFNIPQKLIVVPRPRCTTRPLRLVGSVNTDITIEGFDLAVPTDVATMRYDWIIASPGWINNRYSGFTYRVISSTNNTHTFRLEMPEGTPTSRMVNGQNVSFFDPGENGLKLKLQLLESASGTTVHCPYEFEFTQ